MRSDRLAAWVLAPMAEHAPTGWKSAPERAQIQDELQEARAEADHAQADQVHMVRDVSMMFNELRALADRHAALHADRARLQAELERERAELVRARRPWRRRLMGLKRWTTAASFCTSEHIRNCSKSGGRNAD